MYKQKFPEFKEGVLKKNNLLLEHVILNRNIKREMRLDERKKIKMLKEGDNKQVIENDDGHRLYEHAKTT